MFRQRREIERCFHQEPAANWTVSIRFVIAGIGRVAQVRIVESSIPRRPFDNCLRRIILRLKFPRPTGAKHVLVDYPLSKKPLLD
jgi:outer membrane biosynthesis protein TonB